MVVLVCIYEINELKLKVKSTLEKMGNTVHMIYANHYHFGCSYIMKKLDEYGLHQFRRAYEKAWKKKFLAYIDREKPDLILYVNAPTATLFPQDLDEVREHCQVVGTKQVVWFVDTLFDREPHGIRPYLPYYDKIYVYEKKDVSFLQKKCLCDAVYIPVGFNDVYEHFPMDKKKKYKYDIVFVGSINKRRLQLLDEVAKASAHHGWTLKVIMPWFEKRYFYKNLLLRLKYSSLMKTIDTDYADSEDVARLYAHAKIVLNIHNDRAGSCNPRTFEIMSVGAFCLVDARDDYDDIVVGRDIDVYRDADELIEKIKFWLANDVARERIAANGGVLARAQYSMAESLKKVCSI